MLGHKWVEVGARADARGAYNTAQHDNCMIYDEAVKCKAAPLDFFSGPNFTDAGAFAWSMYGA